MNGNRGSPETVKLTARAAVSRRAGPAGEHIRGPLDQVEIVQIASAGALRKGVRDFELPLGRNVNREALIAFERFAQRPSCRKYASGRPAETEEKEPTPRRQRTLGSSVVTTVPVLATEPMADTKKSRGTEGRTESP